MKYVVKNLFTETDLNFKINYESTNKYRNIY